MKLTVPELLQESGSTNCQALCAQMILHFYGDMVSMEEIMSGLESYVIGGVGMHSEGPAIWLTQRGYDVAYITHDLEVIDRDIENITEEDVEKLKQKIEGLDHDPVNEYRLKKLRLAVDLIQAGAKYSNRIPTLSLVDELLE